MGSNPTRSATKSFSAEFLVKNPKGSPAFPAEPRGCASAGFESVRGTLAPWQARTG